jgi:hypothetical protein
MNSRRLMSSMARYRVELVQTVVETAVIWIEANNEQQAEELALAQVATGADTDWRPFFFLTA